MKTEWDYTKLADAYIARPPYAPEALEEIFTIAGLTRESRVADIGAGVGHLTIPLAERGCRLVSAVEPNDAMRANGIRLTASFPNVEWKEASGEDTGLPSGAYDLVTFGSSFNVMDRNNALRETHRLLRPGGHFVCLWNHRDLDDPVQQRIEAIIAADIPGYGYGVRREDQEETIRASNLFEDIRKIEGRLLFRQPIDQVIEAWRSHATLERQAGEKFLDIVGKIEAYLQSLRRDALDIPYITRAWLARRGK